MKGPREFYRDRKLLSTIAFVAGAVAIILVWARLVQPLAVRTPACCTKPSPDAIRRGYSSRSTAALFKVRLAYKHGQVFWTYT